MYKLLIADDERIERDALRYIITRSSTAITEIMDAVNGTEAIEKARSFRPDLIFLDIKMPGVNGIEAARAIKEILPDARIVFLTAFDYFDYAHEAIRIGVEDFIVKPAADERVMEVIDRVSAELDRRKTLSSRQHEETLRFERMTELLESELIDDLMQRNLSPDQLDSYLRVLEVDSASGYPVCIELDFDSYPMTVSSDTQRTVLKKRSLYRIRDELAEAGLTVLGSHHYATVYLVILCNGAAGNLQTIEQYLERALVSTRRELSIGLNVGIGEYVERTCDYAEAFVHARIGLESNDTGGGIGWWKPHEHESSTERYPYSLEQELIERLLAGDTNGAFEVADTVLDVFSGLYSDHRRLTRKLFELITVVTRECAVEMDKYSENGLDLMERMDEAGHSGEIRGLLRSVLRMTASNAPTVGREAVHAAVEQVRRHIEQNYHDDLSLDQAAGMVRLSPYYFSKVFKQYQGTNFVDFVNRVRVRRARELLRDSVLSIKEISRAVGYSDANYFTRVFKRYEGLTPSGFRSKSVLTS